MIGGLANGAVIAGLVARYLQSQLFGVTAFDISTYLIAMAILTHISGRR
ncbi:MAG TPA: hypothetical protein VGK48_11385 [Terriglobia bacterium]|jgi:hypothetical protein